MYNTGMYTIYRAYHIDTGRSYVGFDSSWPNRKDAHRKKMHSPNRQYFHNALLKHGWEKFEWEILYQSSDRGECLSMEKSFIEKFNSLHEGFNLTEGGEGTCGWHHTEDSKKKIRKSQIGKTVTEETKRKQSAARMGKPSPNKGKKFSDEHKRKLAKSKLGKSRSADTKRKISEKLKGRPSPNKGKCKEHCNE